MSVVLQCVDSSETCAPVCSHLTGCKYAGSKKSTVKCYSATVCSSDKIHPILYSLQTLFLFTVRVC